MFDDEINVSGDYKVAIRAESPTAGTFPLLLNDIVEIRNQYLSTGSLLPVNPTITFNMPFATGATSPSPIHFNFKAFDVNGNEIVGDNAPQSNFTIGNHRFDIFLSSVKQPNQPDPSNPTIPPNPELFSLSSEYGLQYFTKKSFIVDASDNSTGYNQLKFKKITIADDDTNHIIIKGEGSIHLDSTNADIVIEGMSGYGDSPTSVKKSINKLSEKVTQLAAAIPSDIRLKNISGDSTAGLKEINAIEVKNFTYKDDKEKTPHVGVIAQQLQKIFPNSVSKDDKGYLRIKTEEIFYAMVNSIKELCKQIQDLTAKVTGLDKRITELEKQNKMLQEQNKAFEKRLQKLEKQSAKK